MGGTTNPKQKHLFVENTLVSFLAARKSGSADYVEFDVQLTKDLVPVIAHDEEIMIPTKTSDGQTITVLVPVNKVELSTLQKLKPYTLKNIVENILEEKKESKEEDDSSLKKRTTSIDDFASLEQSFKEEGKEKSKKKKEKKKHRGLAESSRESSSEENPGEKEFWSYSEVFPSLEQLFRFLPPSIGFNVEIKYPEEPDFEKYLHIVERNKYVDQILSVIFNQSNGRKVFISSFDPDICLLVSRKQIRYPVFFLTTAGKEIHTDKRRNSIDAAIEFAVEAKLAGIVCDAERLVYSNFKQIEEVHKKGLLLFTYGNVNSDPNIVKQQMSLGVNACICDTLHRVKAGIQKKSYISDTPLDEKKGRPLADLLHSNPYLDRVMHVAPELISKKKDIKKK